MAKSPQRIASGYPSNYYSLRGQLSATCRNATEVAQWAALCCSRPHVAVDYEQWRQRRQNQLTCCYPKPFTGQYPLWIAHQLTSAVGGMNPTGLNIQMYVKIISLTDQEFKFPTQQTNVDVAVSMHIDVLDGIYKLKMRICHLLMRICNLLMHICHLLIRICHLLIRICHLLIRICHLLIRICHLLIRICHLLIRICNLLIRICQHCYSVGFWDPHLFHHLVKSELSCIASEFKSESSQR